MRKRRFFISLVILIGVVSAFLLPVSAHPGKTDANGGHKDHSTGEYHYHHGQEAHQHYDKDGDGKLECPYGFKSNETAPNYSRNQGTSSTSVLGRDTSASGSSTESPLKAKISQIVEDTVIIFVSSIVVVSLFTFIGTHRNNKDKR